MNLYSALYNISPLYVLAK